MPKAAPQIPASLRAVMEEFVTNQTELDRLEPLLDEVKGKNRELRQKLHEYMANAEFPSIKTDTMGTFVRATKGPYASIIDRDKAEEWARTNGLFEDLFKFMPVTPRVSAVIAETLRGDNEIDLNSLGKGTIFDWHIDKTIAWRRPVGLERKES